MSSDLQPAPAGRASYPPREGNRIGILIDGEEAFGRIFAAAAAAKTALWITVSFVDLSMRLPGSEHTLLEFVDSLARRGVDVRLLFWWSEYRGIASFRGEAEELDRLAREGCRVRMRWDQVPHGCHHQKSHIIDGSIAFVGGINLTTDGLSSPQHRGGGYHDLFAEIQGPATADVEANFIERWNQATRTLECGQAFPSLEVADDIASRSLDTRPAGFADGVPAQVLRTIRRDLYRGTAGWQRDQRFEMSGGEHSIRESVLAWIEAAQDLIYLEHQYLTDPDTIAALSGAAKRGVEVIAVLPLRPDANLLLYPEEDMRKTRSALQQLADEPGAALFGLAHAGNLERPIYVHAKLMIIDDRALMLGSANLWPPSFKRDSELDVCVWDQALAVSTRKRLWHEHLGSDELDGLAGWREAAAAHPRARDCRVVIIDAARYYSFDKTAVAPWANLETSN